MSFEAFLAALVIVGAGWFIYKKVIKERGPSGSKPGEERPENEK